MKQIFEVIKALLFFKKYTTMLRWMEIGYSILFWLIVLGFIISLSSCNNDNATISKEEYKQLKSDTVKPEYPKRFKFKEPSFSANWIKWAIIQGEDNHEYLVNNGGNSFAFIHYPDCKKCKKDTL